MTEATGYPDNLNKAGRKALELSTLAMRQFCDDIGGMFDIAMDCSDGEIRTQTPESLKDEFGGMAALVSVKTSGVMDGDFGLLFDRSGLFTLAGVIVMLPEQRIIENRENGGDDEANAMADAMREAGNLLVGSWDRIFRENMPGHGHFVQSDTYVGDPWTEQSEAGEWLSGELVCVSCDMTVDPFPPFRCGVLLPRALFGSDENTGARPSGEAVAEEAAEEAVVASEAKADKAANDDDAGTGEAEAKQKDNEEVKKEKPQDKEAKAEQDTEEAKDGDTEPEEEAEVEEAGSGGAPVEQPSPDGAPEVAPAHRPQAGIERADTLKAGDIMSRDVIWADEDETVQQVLLKMQQNGCGYVLTGKDGIAEGVVSRTDVAGAMSPYLRSVFSRWRRVQDDATLEIKVKWLMSRPVRSLREDAPLSAVVEGFMRYGGGCMPVIGHDGKIIGIITMLDVVRLSAGSDEPTELSGRAIQTMIGVPG